MTWHNVLQFTQASASKPARPTYKPCALKQAAPNSQLITVTLKLNFTVCALWSITKRQMEQVDLSRIDLGEYVVITHTKTSKCRWGAAFNEDVRLVAFKYHVFTRMPGESYHRRLRSLLLLLSCDVFLSAN